METQKENKQPAHETNAEDAEKVTNGAIFDTEEIKIEEMAIDGICGVY